MTLTANNRMGDMTVHKAGSVATLMLIVIDTVVQLSWHFLPHICGGNRLPPWVTAGIVYVQDLMSPQAAKK